VVWIGEYFGDVMLVNGEECHDHKAACATADGVRR
jgi:hypothetical protein